MSSHSETLSHLSIVRKISASKYPVYLATEKQSKQQVAVKTFPLKDKNYQKEKTILKTLDHPHIVKFRAALDEVSFLNHQGSCLELEFAPFGDLLDLIQSCGRMPENLARTLFHQLIDALSYLHEQKVAHLDVKVDNLLIDRDYELKLTDFDLSQEMSSMKLESRGTPGSRAPEIVTGACEDFKAADVYSAAVVLFTLVSGSPPYAEVGKGKNLEFDVYYKTYRIHPEKFWSAHSKHKGNANFYSPEFKDLFTKMLEEDPSKRATIEEVKQSRWYNEPILDKEECRTEMRRYIKQVEN